METTRPSSMASVLALVASMASLASCVGPQGPPGQAGADGADGANGTVGAWIDATAYGAVGDGTTDDTAALQDSLEAGAVQRRPVYVPSGTYLVSASLELALEQVLIGDGRHLSVIRSLSSSALRRAGTLQHLERVTVRGLGFEGPNDSLNDLVGIDADSFSYCTFEDVSIRFYRTGILFRRGPSAEACFFNTIRDLYTLGCMVAVDFDDSNGYSVNACVLDNVIAEDVGVWEGGDGIRLSGYGHTVTGLYVGFPNGNSAVRIGPVTGNCVLTRVYGESSMAYLFDNTADISVNGTTNYVIAPHIDSLDMLPSAVPGDPYLVFLDG